MKMINSLVIVIKVENGKRKAEVTSTQIMAENEDTQKLVVIYVLPKTNARMRGEHEVIQKYTLESLKQITDNNKKVLVENFNCEEVGNI